MAVFVFSSYNYWQTKKINGVNRMQNFLVKKAFLLGLLLTPLFSQKAAASCPVSVFETWKVLSMIREPVRPVNWSEIGEQSHFSRGVMFRDDFGRVFILPRFTSLLGNKSESSIGKAHEAALKQLRGIEHGIEWYKYRVSEEIESWAVTTDNVASVGENHIGQAFGNRANPYVLPDARTIYMTKATHSKVVNEWGTRFRPGNL